MSNLVLTAPSGATHDVTSPAVREVTIRYHLLPGDRVLRQTRMDLVSAGVPESALGSLDGRVLTLSSCIELTAAGWDSLPSTLGGAPGPSGSTGGPSPWTPFATPTREPHRQGLLG